MSRREKKLPGIAKFSKIISETNELSSELEISRIQLKSIEKIIERFEEFYSESKTLERLFYSGEPSDLRLEIINYLDTEITTSGLVIESKEFVIERAVEDDTLLENRSKNDLFKIPVKFSYQAQLKGGYQELLTFMEKLEKAYKYYSISQFDIKSSSDESKLDIFLIINSYCIEGEKGGN